MIILNYIMFSGTNHICAGVGFAAGLIKPAFGISAKEENEK